MATRKKTGVEFLDYFSDPETIGNLRDTLDARSFAEFSQVYEQVAESYVGRSRKDYRNIFSTIAIGFVSGGVGLLTANPLETNGSSAAFNTGQGIFDNTLFDNSQNFRTSKTNSSGGFFGKLAGQTTTRYSYDQGGVFGQLEKALGLSNDTYKGRQAEASIAANL